MSRRGNHEGSVRQRDDGSWEASVAFDGRRYYARRRSQAEARRALGELKQQHASGELVAPSRLTVAEHLANWQEANAGNWRPSTVVGYEVIVRKYLVPAWGNRKLQTLTAPDIARQYGRWREAGVGARTLAIIHARLHRALRQAVHWGLIPRNPADAIEPPRSAYRRPQLWTPEQTRTFVAAIDGEEMRAERLTAALQERQDGAGEAVACLRRNLACGVPSVEIRAAGAILEYGLRASELLDLQSRVEALEALREVRYAGRSA